MQFPISTMADPGRIVCGAWMSEEEARSLEEDVVTLSGLREKKQPEPNTNNHENY